MEGNLSQCTVSVYITRGTYYECIIQRGTFGYRTRSGVIETILGIIMEWCIPRDDNITEDIIYYFNPWLVEIRLDFQDIFCSYSLLSYLFSFVLKVDVHIGSASDYWPQYHITICRELHNTYVRAKI